MDFLLVIFVKITGKNRLFLEITSSRWYEGSNLLLFSITGIDDIRQDNFTRSVKNKCVRIFFHQIFSLQSNMYHHSFTLWPRQDISLVFFFKTIISCIYYYKNFSLSFSRIMMIPTFLSNVDLNHKSLSHKKIYIFIGWMFLVLFDPSLTS